MLLIGMALAIVIFSSWVFLVTREDSMTANLSLHCSSVSQGTSINPWTTMLQSNAASSSALTLLKKSQFWCSVDFTLLSNLQFSSRNCLISSLWSVHCFSKFSILSFIGCRSCSIFIIMWSSDVFPSLFTLCSFPGFCIFGSGLISKCNFFAISSFSKVGGVLFLLEVTLFSGVWPGFALSCFVTVSFNFSPFPVFLLCFCY